MKIYSFLLVIVLSSSFFSCKKNDKDVAGVYTESTPVSGRSQLNFLNGNLMIKSEPGNGFPDSFHYRIKSGVIELVHVSMVQYDPIVMDFKIIDNNTIQIQNLYPSLPEAPKSYMVFKK